MVAGHAACGHRGCTSVLDERWWTGPNMVTVLRTLGTVVLWGMALVQGDERLLLAALLCYWIGDIADGLLARLTTTRHTHSRSASTSSTAPVRVSVLVSRASSPSAMSPIQ